MTTEKQQHLEDARNIQAELLRLIDGMSYCLDWKPGPTEWSARQVIYHLLDTPPGGIAPLVRKIISGSLLEFDLWADKDYVTAERLALEFEQVEGDIRRYFEDLEQAIQEAGEDDLTAKPVLAHWRSRDRDQERTAHDLLEGLFARHWREHLGQLGELRESLGI